MDESPALIDRGWAFCLAIEDFFVNFLRTVAVKDGQCEKTTLLMDHMHH